MAGLVEDWMWREGEEWDGRLGWRAGVAGMMGVGVGEGGEGWWVEGRLLWSGWPH